MMSLLRFAYVIALRRAITGWRLEAVLFGGMVLAVALLASGDIFSNLLADAALRHALKEAPPEDANFWVRSFSSQDDPVSVDGRRQAFRDRSDYVQRNVAVPMERYLTEQSRFIETATFFFQGHPQLELDNDIRPRGAVVHMAGPVSHRVRIIEGEWPSGAGESDGPLDVAVDSLGAKLLGLPLGGVMEVFPAASFTAPPATPVRITGVFERVDPSDEFWHHSGAYFSRQDDRWTIVQLFTSEEILIDRVLGAYPALYTDTTWYFFLDRDVMRAGDVGPVLDRISRIERVVQRGLGNSSFSIKLDSVLRSFDEQLLLARVPLFLVVFLVTGILVYYLALLAGLIVRSRSNEIAMLKSRGATARQLGLLGLGEGLLLAVPAVAIGPFLAAGVVKVLGDVFFGLGGGSDELAGVPVGVSQGAFLLGLAGGVLAVIVFTIASLAAARHGIVEARQAGARPPSVSFLHRYYLDLLLLALIGLLWWQMQSRGAFLSQTVGTRELNIDYSLLLGPVLGLLAAGLIIMRLFPWFAALLSRLVGTVGPAWLVHALRQLARAPMVPGILIVLVTMATALGVMGSALSSTLERNQQERALYAAGADLRLKHSGLGKGQSVGGLAEGLEQTDGVLGAADVYRTSAHVTATGFSTSGSLLAVDSSRLEDVAWVREDFASDVSLNELGSLLDPGPEDPADSIPLPPDAKSMSLWVQPGSGGARVDLWCRIRDANGQFTDNWVGQLDFRGWKQLHWDLVQRPESVRSFHRRTVDATLEPPFTLVSFQVTNQLNASNPGSVFLGGLTAVTSDGTEVPVTDFRSTGEWRAIEDFGRPGLYGLEPSEAAAAPGSGASSRFSWAPGGVGLKGFRPGGSPSPLPALVSSEFLEVADALVGDEVVLGVSSYSLPLKVVGQVDYFPTLDPADGPFAIVDIDAYTRGANRYSPVQPGRANELWLSTGGELPPTEQLVDAVADAGLRVTETNISARMVAQRVDQPLVGAGWGALLVLLFLAMTLATASGVMLYSYLDTRERQSEFALLRTLGSSGRQLNLVLWFNLLFMVACGVGLGTWLGFLIGGALLPLMEVVEGGARVTPPMVFTTDPKTLLVCYLVLAAVTAATVLWLAWLRSRIQLQQVLRMGEG